METFARSLAIKPLPGIELRQATVLPVINRSHAEMLAWRERWSREVTRVDAAGIAIPESLQQLGRPNFFMAYHGLDDRAHQEQLARVYLQACPSLAWTAPHCGPGGWDRPSPTGGRRIRVGVASRFLSRHTIAKLTRGIVARLDRERFEVVVFHLGKADDEARQIAALADRAAWLHGSLAKHREQIAAAELDVLFYPDIGMEPTTYFLSFARLAPVQCVTWGHPVTTGVPTVDAFLSADSMEPPGAEAHYSERLVQLDRLPTWYQRPTPSDRPVDRASLGLPEDATLYVCPQSLFKLHPDFDPAVAEILRRDPRGRFVLIEGISEEWGRLVRERLTAAAPDVANRVLMLPRVDEATFVELLRATDVMLDPFHYGGGNTSYEALAVGAPIVTLPGDFMRGRVTLGAYRQLGIDDLVVETPADYVELALALGNDPALRARLSQRILAAGSALYEDDAAVRAIERYFQEAVAEAADRPSQT